MTTTKHIRDYNQAYFLGIGGIGMSAIARYFLQIGLPVMGYDKTPTPLTNALQAEGALINYNDQKDALPMVVQNDIENTLFVLTPAIPKDHPQWNWLIDQNAIILKRSEVLGQIARGGYCIAVAGTHGKTTTSTLIAHLLHECNINFTAFLGGISANYNTNYLRKTDGVNYQPGGNSDQHNVSINQSDENSEAKEIIVLEADEFDRSFHRLNPDLAVITAIYPDHLDIYGTPEAFEQAFVEFTHLIQPNGGLMIQEDLKIAIAKNVNTYTYGLDTSANYQAKNVHINHGDFCFTLTHNQTEIAPFRCGLPGHHNVQNALAALGICQGFLNLPIESLQKGIASYKGAKRRFEYVHKTENYVVIDDYAHHPEELNAIIGSVRTLYPDQQITGIFQPHLFSRTQDFAQGFADSLSRLDQVWLMDIYPAREKPIPGVTSDWLINMISNPNKSRVNPQSVLEKLQIEKPQILLILGAGDIDRIVQPIANLYLKIDALTQ
jgi:UDP-N-acetylmuramate--alanine ligase